MDNKIKELAEKYNIPEDLFKEALEEEQKRVVLKNRRFSNKLQKMIENYAESEKL